MPKYFNRAPGVLLPVLLKNIFELDTKAVLEKDYKIQAEYIREGFTLSVEYAISLIPKDKEHRQVIIDFITDAQNIILNQRGKGWFVDYRHNLLITTQDKHEIENQVMWWLYIAREIKGSDLGYVSSKN
jgi:hypothetical protein